MVLCDLIVRRTVKYIEWRHIIVAASNRWTSNWIGVKVIFNIWLDVVASSNSDLMEWWILISTWFDVEVKFGSPTNPTNTQASKAPKGETELKPAPESKRPSTSKSRRKDSHVLKVTHKVYLYCKHKIIFILLNKCVLLYIIWHTLGVSNFVRKSMVFSRIPQTPVAVEGIPNCHEISLVFLFFYHHHT